MDKYIKKFSIRPIIVLRIISVYQIIGSVIGLAIFINTIRGYLVGSNFNLSYFLLATFTIIFACIFIFTNVYLLIFGERYLGRFIKFNKWVSFAQIFQFSVLGIGYYSLIGLEVLPYISYLDTLSIHLKLVSFNIGFVIFFKTEKFTDILFGINLVPLLLFILYKNLEKLLLNRDE
jgi:hypothetical protein